MSTPGRRVGNSDAIAAAVLRSQPPHVDDVPDMVDFSRSGAEARTRSS